MSELMRLPRSEKLGVARALAGRLEARLAKGAAPDPVLNEFHAEINAIVLNLGSHVDGAAQMKGVRAALGTSGDECDDVVDCWVRKIYGVLDAEGLRRTGSYAKAARSLCKAAFPKGLEPIHQRVAEENMYCHSAIEVLTAPEHAALLSGIGFPQGWLDAFETAVKKSDEAMAAVAQARTDTRVHVDMGQDGEEVWEDLMIRYRHYLSGWAKKSDAEKRAEGRALIEPLTDAVKKMRAAAQARATLKAKKEAESSSPGSEASVPVK